MLGRAVAASVADELPPPYEPFKFVPEMAPVSTEPLAVKPRNQPLVLTRIPSW
jgi:hypothetical protein